MLGLAVHSRVWGISHLFQGPNVTVRLMVKSKQRHMGQSSLPAFLNLVAKHRICFICFLLFGWSFVFNSCFDMGTDYDAYVAKLRQFSILY